MTRVVRSRLIAYARVLALGCAACSKSPPPAPPVEPSAAASAAAPSSELVVSQELEVAGLHVRSGTLAARGVTPHAGAEELWGFTDLGIDEQKLRLEIVSPERGAPLAKLLPQAGLAVINGGYFEADFKPSTWVKTGGVELSRKSDTSKGGVLAVGSGGTYLGPFSGLSFEPTFAVQSFPLVVEADGKPGIHRDDGRRAARTIACLVGRSLHFMVITAPRGEGPTLFESASLLADPAPRGFGCRVALNLDGGPSTGVWFSSGVAAKQRPPFAPVGYAIAIVPR